MVEQDVYERVGQPAAIVVRYPCAERERNAELVADHGRRGFDTRDPIVGVESQKATADVDCGSAQDFTVAQQAEFGGPTADVDVQQGVAALVGQRYGARTVGGEDALQVVAGRSAHEFA